MGEKPERTNPIGDGDKDYALLREPVAPVERLPLYPQPLMLSPTIPKATEAPACKISIIRWGGKKMR